jgi:hypothetical protein
VHPGSLDCSWSTLVDFENGLVQAAQTACGIPLVDDPFLGHTLNDGNRSRQEGLSCVLVTSLDRSADLPDLGSHGATVVAVVGAALGILPVPLDGACDVSHLCSK